LPGSKKRNRGGPSLDRFSKEGDYLIWQREKKKRARAKQLNLLLQVIKKKKGSGTLISLD